MALTVEQRIELAWPGCDKADVLIIHPLGSRQDTLLYNRRNYEVSTGTVGTEKPCFKDTIEGFEAKMEKSYIANTTGVTREKYQRWFSEYRAAMRFLRSLPDLP